MTLVVVVERRGKAPIHIWEVGTNVIQIGVYRSANLKFQRDIITHILRHSLVTLVCSSSLFRMYGAYELRAP